MSTLKQRQNWVRYSSPESALLLFLGIIAVLLTIASSGCSRSYYRKTADAETKVLIDDKVNVASLPPMRGVQVDRASRMFDPFNPDRPPMPEDDGVAHRYMQRVDGKKHYPLWDVNGWTNTTESPDWWTMLPLDERGVLVLDSDLAVRLATLHSIQYQAEVETIYLSAIDVSSERFLLDNQFYAGWNLGYTADGPDRRGGGGQSQSNLTTGPFGRTQRPFQYNRTFANGTNLLVGFANSMTWQLSGPDTQTSNTLLDMTLIQPLLRGGGRDIILERLTLAERTLLANVRSFERYKTGFYVNVTAGRAAEPGPTRRGGLFGGAGLQGFTGLGGGFGTVGAVQQAPRAVGFGGGGGVPAVGGILGLLQTQLQIRNSEENIARLQDNLLRFEDTLREQLTKVPATQDTIPSQQLQVAQARQALLSAQAQLFSSRNGYEAALDQFKILIGLPPYLCVEIRDPILDQFNLISSEMRIRRNAVANLRDRLGEVNSAILDRSVSRQDAVSGESFRTIQSSEAVDELLGQIELFANQTASIRSEIVSRDIPEILNDLQRLETSIPQRKEQLDKLREIHDNERDLICTLLPTNGIDDEFFSTAALEQLPSDLKLELDKLRQRIDGYEAKIEKLKLDIQILRERPEPIAPNASGVAAADPLPAPVPEPKQDSVLQADRDRFGEVRDKAILQSQNALADLADDVLALQVLQARARTESVLLPEVDISPRDAVEIARRNRLDWMNARSSLVDAWRSIEVVADALESYLDLALSGDIQNGASGPLSLQGKTGRLRAGLQWDSPLTRLTERNNYRQSLIEFQQSRRNFYAFEDTVWQNLRAVLRNIRFNQFNFELQRYAVRVAAQQIILNEDLRQVREALSQGSGPTAARDSVSALSDLLQAQNTFLNVWVFYESQRRNLDQDLGTIQVDSDGIWIDPGKITAERFLGNVNETIIEEEVIGNEVIVPRENIEL